MIRCLMMVLLVASVLLPSGHLTAAQPEVLTLKVDHLACLPCAERFREALQSVCKELTLDTQKGEAVCTYEDPVTPKQILKKANRTGLPTKCVGKARIED